MYVQYTWNAPNYKYRAITHTVSAILHVVMFLRYYVSTCYIALYDFGTHFEYF